jgi:Spy/CpxP family protein refolding chaperone
MKANLKALAMIFSVILNMVFVAAYIAYRIPLFSSGERHGDSRGPLFLELNLTARQVEQFQAERNQFHVRLQELGEQVKNKQIELIDLLAIIPPDQRVIEEKQGEIRTLQGAIQDSVIMHMLHVSTFLTLEQRSRFFQLVKVRIENSGQPCPPWAKPFESGPAGGQ